jgi:Sec-independent protein translocase protein TatA
VPVGPVEILLVLLALLVLGPRRVANLFRAVGRGAYDFVDGLGGGKADKELPDGEPREREDDGKRR